MNIGKPLKWGKIQSPTMVINGVPQESPEQYVVQCPTCNRPVAQFNPNTSLEEAYKFINREFKGSTNYCVFCGQKFEYPDIIDVEVKSE